MFILKLNRNMMVTRYFGILSLYFGDEFFDNKFPSMEYFFCVEVVIMFVLKDASHN